jgi:hypothetical protein
MTFVHTFVAASDAISSANAETDRHALERSGEV